ncbi:MAG: 3-keto-5-aminohexanoate cleavage protein [Alphaproteobacteria bacterium]|nr:3-keto-5-aminohexanoate cleavage protein [Alphaproteobacteria bacterium]
MGKRVGIVAAVNGGMQQDREGAKIPITPEQIAEDAALCFNEGAAVVHIHARDAQGNNSSDLAIYQDIIRRIRAACGMLIQTTNGIGVRRDPKTGEFLWPSDEDRLALLTIVPKPDLYGIAAGTIDFYHPEGGYPVETPYVNTQHFLKSTLPQVFKIGSTVEFELVEVSVVHRLARLADQGVFDRNASNLWMLHGGGLGNTPPTARALVYSVDEQQRLFPNAKWGVLGAGKAQFTMIGMGVSMGCDTVRVGFEDNIYLPNGSAAKRNHELVRAARAIIEGLGCEAATPDDLRQTFQLRPAA